LRSRTAILSAKEFVGAIAEANLGVAVAHRNRHRAAEIGNRRLPRSRDGSLGVVDDRTLNSNVNAMALGGLVMDTDRSATEQNGSVRTSIGK